MVGLVHASGEPFTVYGEATLILNLGGGLVVYHIFLVADLATDSHCLAWIFVKHRVHVELVSGLIETAGWFYQMFSEGKCKDTQPISFTQDITIPIGSELVA